MSDAPGREPREAQDEGRSGTTEREIPDPVVPRTVVAEVIRDWLSPWEVAWRPPS